MQKWIKVLTGLFVFQLVLVVLFNAQALQGPTGKTNTPLIKPSPTTATKVVIQAQNEEPVTLVKQEDKWTLPAYFGLNVNAEKLDGFLDKLSQIQRSWPEATTDEAQTRFEVAEDKYQRRISLFFDEKGEQTEKVLYLGTSPGYQKTHARLADASEIYSVDFSNYEASTGPETWFNTHLLTLELERINRIETPDFILEQIKGEWRLADLSPEEVLDAKAVKVFVNQVANFKVKAALTDDPESEQAKREAQLTLTAFMTGSADPVTFRLALSKPGTHYILKSSQSPLYFRLPKGQGDRVVDVSRADFVTEQSPTGDQADSASDNASATSSPPNPHQQNPHAQPTPNPGLPSGHPPLAPPADN